MVWGGLSTIFIKCPRLEFLQYKQKKKVDSDPGGEYVDFEDINDNS